ncbi:hypothetical protein PO878_04020 [Iamia majanohamensis]|uniref:Uncharacterized protein n=1 Tax=Iamia majanohamensis TaxID=467976 RepID=A0AAE9YBC2_9ACTN|nr:hypothetical protein [Iamia majanohamensis]WCO67889.1 hypothetical protein PO878_04020 [Iamia majanohamensis]
MFVVKAFLKTTQTPDHTHHHAYEAEHYTVGQKGDSAWLRFAPPRGSGDGEVTLWVGPRAVNGRLIVENRHGKTVENLRAMESGFAGL